MPAAVAVADVRPELPSVRVVLAWPLAFVLAVVGATEPPPPLIANVTATLGNGLPLASRTCTTSGLGRVAPAVPVWLSPLAFVIFAVPPPLALNKIARK